MFICHERGTKNSESPVGIEPMVSQIPVAGALTTELQETHGELGHFSRFICDTCPAYC